MLVVLCLALCLPCVEDHQPGWAIAIASPLLAPTGALAVSWSHPSPFQPSCLILACPPTGRLLLFPGQALQALSPAHLSIPPLAHCPPGHYQLPHSCSQPRPQYFPLPSNNQPSG